MKASSPGLDNRPHWFYQTGSYEIAEVVTPVLNSSFSSGAVPHQWQKAVITPVRKVAKPDSLVEYRPISITPLLSRLAEKLVVNWWLAPSIPPSIISDQFGFRKTGSTTCASTYLLHICYKELNNIVFCAIVMSRILYRYALPAWGGFLTYELTAKIDSFLRKAV